MPAGFMLPPGYTLAQLLEKNKGDKVQLWIGTRNEFEGLASTEPNTLYLFTDDPTSEALSTLCISDNLTGDYKNVYVCNYGMDVYTKIKAGLYSVRARHKKGSTSSFMMGFTNTSSISSWDSTIFPYTNSNNNSMYAFVRAKRDSTDGTFKLTVQPLNDTSTSHQDFDIAVRRIGSIQDTE